ncbi:hypothetical protein CVIRNUC_009775 [Coccomyxa viridis]|uniref:Uncharacterized protein n=1 Tax=Coccomyxa viridis TaxID=1274662 RepID=A0AAV1IIR1_9CHLO|nr:hypothetical protein CVIRNUC_009775 [Coccomyxa viridis]
MPEPEDEQEHQDAPEDAQAPTPCVRKGAGMQDGVFDYVEDALAIRGAEGSDLSRCGTPQQQQGVPAKDDVLAGLPHGYAVPFPDSSTLGMSPRGHAPVALTTDSGRSDESYTNMVDLGSTESPPWSPRRVPPAHLWGEGPPRFPGYRSGGATLPNKPGGMSASALMEAACELQALMDNGATSGTGLLLHAQPYFPSNLCPPDAHPASQDMQPAERLAASLSPATPILQAPPLQGHPSCAALHGVPLPGMLCAEGAVLSPVAMQLLRGRAFPRPCMWDLDDMQLKKVSLAPLTSACTDEATSSSAAAACWGNARGGLDARSPTSELMGISPALPRREPLQPRQMRGPDTPGHAEADKTDDGRRQAESGPTEAEGAPSAPQRKPRRATKRRLF